MMGNAFNLGKLFGIQFRLHYTWFIIFVLVTISLVSPDWSSPLYWAVGIVTSLLFFASILAHELAHSLVGRANNIPIKSITLFIFGGVAQMTREAKSAGAELKMAVAGPVCSLVLAGLFYALYYFTRDANMPVWVIAYGAYQLFFINVALAAFNMIPGFPLDGGRVFRSIMWKVTGNYKRSTQIAARIGQGVGYLFILAGILIAFLRPFGLDLFSGLWIAFIGWFLQNAASASYGQVRWRGALQGLTASQVMTSNCPTVPSGITVNQLIQGYIYTGGHGCFLVADEGRVRGILTLRGIKSTPRSDWDLIRVGKIMTPIDKLVMASPDQDALSILERMEENNITQMAVVSEGKIIGLVIRDNLLRIIRTRSALGV
jgi:Zn-dependent protease/predicted transcriptional regulator